MTKQSAFAATARVAVFIDGDNLSSCLAGSIMTEVQGAGILQTLRVYGNAERCSGWRCLPGFQFIDAGAGKSAADILLCVEVMTFVAASSPDTVIIASSDGDFRHLAFALRAAGVHVLGLGEEKCPATFQAACSGFHILATPPETAKPPAPTPCNRDVRPRQIRTIIAELSLGGSGALVTDVNVQMKHRHGVNISQTEHKTWRQYFEARPALFDIDPKGPAARVRFLPQAFAAQA